jgi:Coenzyme PQQ synthesis protein D (PqqD)
MNLNSNFSVPNSVMARKVGDEVIVLDLTGGEYFGLPAVGATLWEHIQDNQPLSHAVAKILDEYDIDRSTVESDVLRLVGELCQRGLLVETSPQSAIASNP